MTRNIAFISQPLDQLQPNTDTTWALMEAAQAQGHQLFWMEASDLHINNAAPVGYMAPLALHPGQADPFELGDSFLAPLRELDAIWWRKSAPYSLEDAFLLDVLQMAQPHTTILNNPRSLRSLNQQLYPLQFPQLLPPTLVTQSIKAVQGFLSEIGGKAVMRSASSGGRSFFLRKGDPNLGSLIGSLTQNESQCVIVQKLITEPGLDGDKRLFLLDGTFLDIALQIPAIGQLRGSFERGATPATAQPSDKDLQVAQIVGQKFKEDGIFFATVDVSDGLIVDINLTCPGGLTQLQQIAQDDIGQIIFQRLQRLLG